MKLTPLNIKNQVFNRSVRGYDKDEVHAFLEKISDDVESISSENERLKKKLADAENQIKEYKKIEKNLQSTLLHAQENSSKAVESAKKQTSMMVKEAEIKANQVIEKAKREANFIKESVNTLREERNLIISRLKAMVAIQSELLDIHFKKEEKKGAVPEEKKEEPNTDKNTDINVNDILDKLL